MPVVKVTYQRYNRVYVLKTRTINLWQVCKPWRRVKNTLQVCWCCVLLQSPELEKFLLSLSHTTLIGRQVPDNRPLGDHLCSDALKFVNGDIYYVLACLCCGNRSKKFLSVRAACDCEYCQVVREMRNNYIFMGPSPLILHATVSKEKPSGQRTLQALRLFRKLVRTHISAKASTALLAGAVASRGSSIRGTTSGAEVLS